MDAKPQISIVVPFYNQPAMLGTQFATWMQYSDYAKAHLQFIIVDDGSQLHRAADALSAAPRDGLNLELYQIDVDIPWNRAGARNLGSAFVDGKWLVHLDIDHVLPPEAADALVGRENDYNPKKWYRFRRFRVGAADETRNKDKIPREQKFGEIKPHIDSYLCTRDLYLKVGGYDEDYSGCLGGGSPFLKQLEAAAAVQLLPPDTFLHVYTRYVCKDSSASLNRDTSEYTRRRKAKERAGNTTPKNPLRFPWHRVF